MAENTTSVDIDDRTKYPEQKAAVLIWKIVPPALMSLGTLGNILSILVLIRPSIRSSTIAIFLIGLAISDLLVLYSGLLRHWLRFMFAIDVREVGPFWCKFNIWLVYTSLDFSAWILMVVTIERVISAWIPYSAKSLCTRKAAFSTLASIFIFLAVLNSHMLYGKVYVLSQNKSQEGQKGATCMAINDKYNYFFENTWPWIDLCVFCLIPFSVILIGNIIILCKVLSSRRKACTPSVRQDANHREGTSLSAKETSLTAMLVTLNIVFLICTSPISIYNIGFPLWKMEASGHNMAVLDLWWAVVNMLQYTSNSLNFLLYCLSGSKFRHEVTVIFCKIPKEDTKIRVQLSKYKHHRNDCVDVVPTTSTVSTNTEEKEETKF